MGPPLKERGDLQSLWGKGGTKAAVAVARSSPHFTDETTGTINLLSHGPCACVGI